MLILYFLITALIVTRKKVTFFAIFLPYVYTLVRSYVSDDAQDARGYQIVNSASVNQGVVECTKPESLFMVSI